MKIAPRGPNENCLAGWRNTSLSGSVELRRSRGGWTTKSTKRAVFSVGHASRIRFEVLMPVVYYPERLSMIYLRLRQGCPTRTWTSTTRYKKTNGLAEEGSVCRQLLCTLRKALANTSASTQQITRSGACEIPGKAHFHDSGREACSPWWWDGGERCSLPRRALRITSESYPDRTRRRGIGRLLAAAGKARHTRL